MILPAQIDILIIGAGAAGLMAALAARGVVSADGKTLPSSSNSPSVAVVNNESRLGMKILVSGGGRCNVTNTGVSNNDYLCDKPRAVKGVLREFSCKSVQEFFESRGVPIYSEPLGKIFPKSDKAADILACLLDELKVAEIPIYAPYEALSLQPVGKGWSIEFSDGKSIRANKVVLATGGKSIPGTGSRGFGYRTLAKLGHDVNTPIPALTPVNLTAGPLSGHAGLTVPAVLTLVPDAVNADQLSSPRLKPLGRAAGSLLITHDGISGPCGLDISGAVGLGLLAKGKIFISADFWTMQQPEGPWSEFLKNEKPPGACLAGANHPSPSSLEVFKQQVQPLLSPEQSIGRALAAMIPRKLLLSLLDAAGIDSSTPCRALDKGRWRQLWLALTQARLQPISTGGFQKAEVTHGGLSLDQLNGGTLESRSCKGLYVCGEVLNVTGRLGGFNFQWAWSSGFVAGKSANKKEGAG